jgi:hypothetical protein
MNRTLAAHAGIEIGRGNRKTRLPRAGTVLFEVVLALALFVGAAVVIGTALNSSVQALERQRWNTHAADLAVTILSEMQMGLRPIQAAGPEPFEAPFEDWTWEIVETGAASPLDAPRIRAMHKVEIVIGHTGEGAVHRLIHWLPVSPAKGPAQESPAGPETEGSPASDTNSGGQAGPGLVP